MKNPLITSLAAFSLLAASTVACGTTGPTNTQVFPAWDDIRSAVWLDYGRMLDSSAVEMARDFGAPLADAGELAWVWTDDGSFFVLQKSQATADAMWNDVKARTKLGGHQARPHAVLNMLMVRPGPDTLLLLADNRMADRALKVYESGSPFPQGARGTLVAAVKTNGHYCELHELTEKLFVRCTDKKGTRGLTPDVFLRKVRDRLKSVDPNSETYVAKHLDEVLANLQRKDGWLTSYVTTPEKKGSKWVARRLVADFEVLLQRKKNRETAKLDDDSCARLEALLCDGMKPARCELVKKNLALAAASAGSAAKTACAMILADPETLKETIKGFKAMPLP